MNYYEIIYLKQGLKTKLTGCIFEQAISPYKNFLELFFGGAQQSFRLCFSSAPGNTALFTDTYRAGKKRNVTNFFTELEGQKVTSAEIAETDRWLWISFENGLQLRFRLFSNQANTFLCDGTIIKEAFKDYDTPGDAVPQPKELDLFKGDISRKSTKNQLTSLNLMLPRQNLEELIEIHELEEKEPEQIESFVQDLTEVLEHNAVFRSLKKNGNTTLLPENWLPLKTDKEFDTVNDLIAWRYKTYSRTQRLKQKRSTFLKALKKKIKRLNSGLSNLDNADKGLERAEKYEKYGHLLMAHAHEASGMEKEMTVDDLYEEGKQITIPLKEKLDIAANAERYYKKARTAEKSYEEALERIPKLEKEKAHYEQLLTELEDIDRLWDLQDWEKEHKDHLNVLLNTGNNTDAENLPYHTLEVKGYPVWIGKNAKSNDKLVQHAHKEDVWMHARGVPGSHLVIRMGNQKDMPPRPVLLEAASYAAYNSKLKGAKLVPVIITKKKYVRKPKGSAPGAVLVDKEDVEMVSPVKPKV